ncbi:nif11-like leader peptide domain protein [Synechococcus sp. BIOS-E4-1]|uniref:Nif11-like leader peptide family natural product precursor n=1 Tax=Synechococcus sp. BIOS-E4-1 TaxID=1400864 RepID=UPI001644122F|nr:Nif11-like leader peptide family natural product precursor [Synechococcus sp. BIOS-E4-1]QNI54562.1 nif11-like leader peptide domain protein [Synechococcus sp. BIOS-E4-1]
MSEEQLKAFLEKVQADTSLQEQLKAADDSDAVLAIAKKAGFSIYADDLIEKIELAEEVLEAISGGEYTGNDTGPTNMYGVCHIPKCPEWAASKG